MIIYFVDSIFSSKRIVIFFIGTWKTSVCPAWLWNWWLRPCLWSCASCFFCPSLPTDLITKAKILRVVHTSSKVVTRRYIPFPYIHATLLNVIVEHSRSFYIKSSPKMLNKRVLISSKKDHLDLSKLWSLEWRATLSLQTPPTPVLVCVLVIFSHNYPTAQHLVKFWFKTQVFVAYQNASFTHF